MTDVKLSGSTIDLACGLWEGTRSCPIVRVGKEHYYGQLSFLFLVRLPDEYKPTLLLDLAQNVTDHGIALRITLQIQPARLEELVETAKLQLVSRRASVDRDVPKNWDLDVEGVDQVLISWFDDQPWPLKSRVMKQLGVGGFDPVDRIFPGMPTRKEMSVLVTEWLPHIRSHIGWRVFLNQLTLNGQQPGTL